MSSELSEVTLISLPDKVLLHIFSYLSWIDSINLAATCKRMANLNYWLNKNNELDLIKYVDQAPTVPIENVLSAIGPHIRAVKINEQAMSKSFMEKCCNVKSIKIGGCISQSAAITLNKWIRKLKAETISIGDEFENYSEDLLMNIEGLNAFVFDSFQKLLPGNFFDKNPSIQHLRLVLVDYYELALDLSSLLVLHSLKSLFLTTERTAVLDDVKKFVKIDRLREFSVYILDDDWDSHIWNSFAKHLAEKTKLDKLRMIGCIDIDEATFSTFSLFNLTSLWLDVDYSWDDFSTAFYESPAPRLKYLRLKWCISWCNSSKIGHIVKMWTTVEAICFDINDESDLLHHFKDEFFSDILKLSNERPVLRLHIFSSEIRFNFISKWYDVVEGKKCCSCKDSFELCDNRVNCYEYNQPTYLIQK